MSGRGRWVAAALVAGCCVLGGMIVVRDCGGPEAAWTSRAARDGTRMGDAPERATPQRERSSVADATPSAGAIVVVRVVATEDGSPIEGATVAVPGASDEALSKPTDAGGVAEFAPLAVHEWAFQATAAGRLARTASIDAVEHVRTTLTIALDAAASLDVHVVDASGAAVRGATISVDSLGGGPSVAATADTGGRALVLAPHGDVVRIVARSAGVGEGEVAVRTPRQGAAPLEVALRLDPPGRLVGVVFDAEGGPAPGAYVAVGPAATRPGRGALRDLSRNAPPDGWVSVRADKQGRFVADGLTSGCSYAAIAMADSWPPDWSAWAERIAPNAASPDVHRDLTLQRPGELIVHVAGSDAEAVANARVWWTQGHRQPPSGPRVPDGAFTGPVLPFFRIAIQADWLPSFPVVRELVVAAGEKREVTIRLEAPYDAPETTGTVLDECGNAIPDAPVSFHSDSTDDGGEPIWREARSGPDGTFSLPLVDRTYRVRAEAPGHIAAETEAIRLPARDLRIVLRRSAKVRFRLLQPDGTGYPKYVRARIGETAVSALPVAPWDGWFQIEYEPATGDELRVSFHPSFANATSARPTLRAAEYAPIVRPLHPVPGGAQDLGEIVLEPPSPLRGRVVDAAGRAVPGAVVRPDFENFENVRWFAGPRWPVPTDADGAFSIEVAGSSGSVPLVVSAPGFLDLHVAAASGAAFTLRRGGVVWGEVVDADGAAMADATVRISRETGAATTTCDGHGIFGLRVAPGRVVVSANGAREEAVDVPEGGDVEVHLVSGTR